MFATAFDFDAKGQMQTIAGAPAGHDARILADLARRARHTPIIHVAEDDLRAAFLSEAIGFFAPDVTIIPFPAWDCLPYDRISPHASISSQRLQALIRAAGPWDGPAIYLTTAAAIGQKTLPPDALRAATLDLRQGADLSMEKLRAFLATYGYSPASTVREKGEYAFRGGIVDLFPSDQDMPLRLDFFGDTIDSLRVFDPLTQTSLGAAPGLVLHPISEVLLTPETTAHFRSRYRAIFGAVTDQDPLYEAVAAGQKYPGLEHWLGLFYPALAGLLDYLPNAPVLFDTGAIEAIKAHDQHVADFYESRQSLFAAHLRSKKKRNADQTGVIYKPAPVDLMYETAARIAERLTSRASGQFSPFAPVGAMIDGQGRSAPDLAASRNKPGTGLYDDIAAIAAMHQGQGRPLTIACYSAGAADRMGRLLRDHGMTALYQAPSWRDTTGRDIKLIRLCVLGIDHGFIAPDVALLSEQDLLGDRLVRAPKKRRTAAKFQIELGAMNPGDFVVHAEHGIGRYEGLEAITALGTTHDCVKLVYDNGDKLFVPVENLDVLSRYGGAESGAVLDRLGGLGWQTRKARVKKRLKDMADVLIKIAAARALKQGDILQAPPGTYQEFAARFPYPETDDQSRAIEDVLSDLASGKPMDRLVCGDVGFGKTEVALRAAFAAVQSGAQVALIAPTTLLARQHYNQFCARFKGFPIRIAQLSRMVGSVDAKKTKEGIKQGDIDICIGTHALLAKDIGFARLGLLIIDEEQHFGVKQKESLKQFRADVHVLTLTATPIPRTLQLALAGVQELSLIATPPVDRLAVRTYVLPYDPVVIREALMREHYRGGQSFYVCPRIEDLDKIAAQLRELVPEIKFVIAHGRMTAAQLDDIMTAFDAKKFDILLATNIVESGIDIPNANTIILHRSDLFGLSQLYQLRGRVGRSKQRGYAYYTYAAEAPIAPTSLQRLEIIQTLDQLGAGFQLASHDMDLRGAGNLLGEEQSGHIREVGIELYQQMLEDAVAAAKAEATGNALAEERWIPQINTGLSVLIPETYVADLNVRLGLYRRLAEGADKTDIESIAAEMIDRFGPLPVEVENLLQTVEIKYLCKKAGVLRLDLGPKGAVIGFYQDLFARPDKLVPWIAGQSGTVRVRPDQKLVVVRAFADAKAQIEGMKAILETLVQLAHG